MDDRWTPVTVTLSRPVEAHGEQVTTLTLAEPTLGVLDGVHLDVGLDGRVRLDLGDIHRLVAGMAGIPPSSARQIGIADMAKVARAVMDFLPSALRPIPD